MEKINLAPVEEMMVDFNFTREEVEDLTTEWYINTPGVEKINGEYYFEEEL